METDGEGEWQKERERMRQIVRESEWEDKIFLVKTQNMSGKKKSNFFAEIFANSITAHRTPLAFGHFAMFMDEKGVNGGG